MSDDEASGMKESIMRKIMTLKEDTEKEQTDKELDLLHRSTEEKTLRTAELVNNMFKTSNVNHCRNFLDATCISYYIKSIHFADGLA